MTQKSVADLTALFSADIERAKPHMEPFTYDLVVTGNTTNWLNVTWSDGGEIKLYFEDRQHLRETLEAYMDDRLLPEGSQDTPETWKAFSKQLWENQNE